jgi:hypothetical protein
MATIQINSADLAVLCASALKALEGQTGRGRSGAEIIIRRLSQIASMETPTVGKQNLQIVLADHEVEALRLALYGQG